MQRFLPILAAFTAALVLAGSSDAREPLRARRATLATQAPSGPGEIAPAPRRAPAAPSVGTAVIATPGVAGGGALPGPGGFQNAPAVGFPTFAQLNGWNAVVPMQHASCGADCYQHEIIPGLHNTAVLGKVSMTCPAGQVVSSLHYEINGMASPTLIATATLQTEFTNIVIHPFSAEDFESTGQGVFGGSWSGSPDANPNASAVAFEPMQDVITVVGQCSGGPYVAKPYPVNTKAKFIDKDF